MPFYCNCLIFVFLGKKKQTTKQPKTRKSLEPCAERSIFAGSCTRTTPGTTTRRPAAAAHRRSSQTPSPAAAARSGARSLPQATRYHKTTTEVSVGRIWKFRFLLNVYYCFILFNLGIRLGESDEPGDINSICFSVAAR